MTYARDLASQASMSFEAAQTRNVELARIAEAKGMENQPIKLREGGPDSKVKWSFPILPGVLVVNSYVMNGPLFAEGGTKLVLYYGVSSRVICTITKWMS